MKAGLLFSVFSLLIFFQAFPQYNGDLSKVPSVKKGKIFLMDGNQIRFVNLTPMTDSVILKSTSGISGTLKESEIFQIRKTGSHLATGAIVGGSLGLVGGLFFALSVSRATDIFATIFTFGLVNDVDTRQQEIRIVVTSSLTTAILGGVVGYFIKKEKVLYQNPLTIGFAPTLQILPGNKTGFLVTVTLNFR